MTEPAQLPPPPPPPAPSQVPYPAHLPPAPMPAGKPSGRAKRKGRPRFVYLIVLTIGFRGGRELLERVALRQFGIWGLFAVAVTAITALIVWRLAVRQFVQRRKGGQEFTPEAVRAQIAESEVGEPAFAESGTLLGTSVFVLNQHAKILEIETAYDIFGGDGTKVGEVRQIGQTKAKQWARGLTGFDQFFTHHFEVSDRDGTIILRVTRPAKWFLSKVHVFDANNGFIGTISQKNVFGKINFPMLDAAGRQVGTLKAGNIRAWDFEVVDAYEQPLASIVKSWEGWTTTAFTRADKYVVKVHHQLPYPLRELTLATVLTVDLALKQDARGLG